MIKTIANKKASTKKTAKFSEADLRQFAGDSVVWFRHPDNGDVHYTMGVRYVAKEGGAQWLIDEIALSQRSEKRLAGQPFQVWKLTVNADHTGMITVEDGNDTVLFTKALDDIDFPLPEIILWLSDNVILLPTEY